MADRRKDEPREEVVFQAVVICDSFNSLFDPLTLTRSRALLPLVNVPLIDYTLSFLVNAGIDDIIIYCCNHFQQVKDHVEQSRWVQATGGQHCKVAVVVNEDCISMGDALRDLDAKNLIRSDFVLVTAGAVANLDLKSIILKHKERRRIDKGAVMTLVMKQAHPQHRIRSMEDNVFVCAKKSTNQLLHYQRTATTGGRAEIPLELVLEQKASLHLRYDLLDTYVSICSPDVPQLYTDNFDYLTLYDFIKGILVNEEILGNTIYLEVIRDEYAASVSNLYLYDCISRDIIGRWSFPYCPDSNLLAGTRSAKSGCSPCYSYGRHHVYLGDVKLDGQPQLKENVVVASGSSIGDQSVICNSVIGRNCKIGRNVKIEGSYLWDNVTVEDDCLVEGSLLCDGVSLGRGAKVKRGCLLAPNVVIGTEGDVERKFIISGSQQLPHGAVLLDCPAVVSGCGDSKAYYYEKEDSDTDGDSIDDSSRPEAFGISARYGSSVPPLNEESGGEVDDSDNESDGIDGMSSDGDSPLPDDGKVFYSELLDTIKRAEEESIAPENLVLEINSLKHAYNIQIKEVNQLLVQAFLEFPQQDDFAMPPNLLMTSLKPLLRKWLAVFKNYYRSTESQLDCLQAIEDFCSTHDNVLRTLPQLLMFLYQSDVLDEENIHRWYKAQPEAERVRSQASKFILWLTQADEESD